MDNLACDNKKKRHGLSVINHNITDKGSCFSCMPSYLSNFLYLSLSLSLFLIPTHTHLPNSFAQAVRDTRSIFKRFEY